jgi:hypothetical protein
VRMIRHAISPRLAMRREVIIAFVSKMRRIAPPPRPAGAVPLPEQAQGGIARLI